MQFAFHRLPFLRLGQPLIGMFLLLAAHRPAFAQDPPLPFVAEPPVDQALAAIDPPGTLQLSEVLWERQWMARNVQYTVQVPVLTKVKNPETGEEKVVEVTVPETKTRTEAFASWVSKQRVRHFPLALVSVQELGGDAVTEADLNERLAEPRLVLVELEERELSPTFAVLFKPETLVVRIPAAANPSATLPTPAPVPASAPAAPPTPAPAPPPVSAPSPPLPPATPSPAVAAPVPTHPQPQLPDGLPLFRLARLVDEQQLSLRYTQMVDRAATRYRMVTETTLHDGQPVTVCKCVPITARERYEASLTTIIPWPQVRASTADGREITDLHRQTLRQREIPVVVSRSGLPVDAFWLQNLKPRMLVLTPPAEQLPQAAAAPAAPPSTRPTPPATGAAVPSTP